MPAKPLEAIPEPKVLLWARESLGITVQEVAKRLNVNETAVTKWEAGEKYPTIKRLEELAKIYKRPLAVFFLSKPPEEPPLPKDFRTLPAKERAPFSPKTRLAIRRARRLQSLAVELARNFNREIISKVTRARLSDHPEAIAMKLRSQLGVEIQTQFGWKSEDEAFEEWKKTVESFGVFVFQMSMPLEEVRGFSLIDGNSRIIVINAGDSVRAKIFSLFHEFAHLLLSNSGICDMEERDGQSGEINQIEKFCNHFAGALLVPKEVLQDHVSIMDSKHEWSEEVLRQLAEKFKVSQEVILRRLLILGLTTRNFYERKRKEWQKKAEEWKKKRFVRQPNPPKRCIRENGAPFVSLVLENHKGGKITYGDVADYLAVRLKYLHQIERLVVGRG